ncbi:MAG: very short patch repair endonuclease [Candidatus Omnitrophica bacterium]|nr:very short patch repair endonuclease [Candidatus Omnitrophota bacterium]
MDNLSRADRRKNMQSICSKNTGIEKTIFSLLKGRSISFKKHYQIIGKPDIAFPKHKVAVFLDSDFWHGWNFPRWKNKLPKAYWRDKIENNRKRDKRNTLKLRRAGWKVVRIWSHEIKNNPQISLRRILKEIND